MNSFDEMDDIQVNNIEEETVEEKLEHLDDFDNATRMELLNEEIDHIMMHGVQPNENWYENRMNYIQEYQTIDWKDMAVRSYQRDDTIYDLAVSIIDHLEQLEEEWSTSPIFNLCVYQRLLANIRIIWHQYSKEYGVQGSTVDILDVINSMDNM
jgi:predicted transcriptional regulator